jgi:hypothetical protein
MRILTVDDAATMAFKVTESVRRIQERVFGDNELLRRLQP